MYKSFLDEFKVKQIKYTQKQIKRTQKLFKQTCLRKQNKYEIFTCEFKVIKMQRNINIFKVILTPLSEKVFKISFI